jgi:segregation and condensation protein A
MFIESSYTVKTNSFEGPLHVLLSLIEKKKLHISDVSLARVTDDYIQYVQNNLQKHLDDSTLFLSIATTLVLIKSRLLLEKDIDDSEIKDASHELEMRLSLLSVLRNGIELYIHSLVVPFLDIKKRNLLSKNFFIAHPDINRGNLFSCIESVLSSIPKEKDPLPAISVVRVMSLEQMMNKLRQSFSTFKKASFKDITESLLFENMTYKEAKVNTIVSFLAVLELVRGGSIDVFQDNTYEDIICETSHILNVN